MNCDIKVSVRMEYSSEYSNISSSKYKRCDYLGCTEEAPFHCSTCSSFYCDHHPFRHDCIPDQHLSSLNSNYNIPIKTNKSFLNDGKCEYLGCCGDAPFYCRICTGHYCDHHPFRHDCIPDQHLAAVNKNSKFETPKKTVKRSDKLKCDHLGCSTDAPFYCSACSSFYCQHHALNHDCIHYSMK